MPKFRFTVTLDIANPTASVTTMKAHIRSAIKQWGGEYSPGHSLHPSNIRSVKVKPFKENYVTLKED